MNKKILFILLGLVCLSLFAYAVKISGPSFTDLTPAGTAAPTVSGVKVIEGNPFAKTTFEKGTTQPATACATISQECKNCSTIMQCLACIDKMFVECVFPTK